MHYYIICDYRENLDGTIINESSKEQYSDHPTIKNIMEIISCMKEIGYDCSYFGGIPELIHAVDTGVKFTDSVFLNLSDGMNQDYSRAQAPVLLDILGAQYSGSGVFASVLMNNKYFCKQALKGLNIQMSKACLINGSIPFSEDHIKDWKYPLFIKPNCEGSSVGISKKNVCETVEDVHSNVKKLLPQYRELILEEFAQGVDVTNYLIGNGGTYTINDVIVAVLNDTSDYAIYGPEEKHFKLRTLYHNDEYLPAHIVQQIQQESVLIAKAVGAVDICRVDYRFDPKTEEVIFIEINSAPRFSNTSEIGFIAKKRGLSFKDMVQVYINTFIDRIGN